MITDAKIEEMSHLILSHGALDRLTILGIEYETKNITAERFSKRVIELLAEYQKDLASIKK